MVVEAFGGEEARGRFLREQPYELLPKCLRTVLQGQVWVNTTGIKLFLECSDESSNVALGSRSGQINTTLRGLTW